MTQEGNILTFPEGEFTVPTGTPPFDLGEPIGFDDNTFFPKGDGFLDDVLNGRFEFPLEGEAGPYVLYSRSDGGSSSYDLTDPFYEGAIPNVVGEPSLETTSYENARNVALERIGEIDPATREKITGRVGVGKGKTVGFRTVVDGVPKVYRVDWDPNKEAHINIEVGKGKTRKKLAVEFPGTEADVDTIYKDLAK